MNTLDLVACGVVWRNYGKEEAGRELVRALKDPDAQIRALARTLLADAGERSGPLIQSAIEAGELIDNEAAWNAGDEGAQQAGAERASVTWDARGFTHGCAEEEAAPSQPLVRLRGGRK